MAANAAVSSGRRSTLRFCDKTSERAQLVGVRDRIERIDALAIRLDRGDRVQLSVVEGRDGWLTVDAHDFALCTKLRASPCDGVPQPRDTLGADERTMNRNRLAAAIGDHDRILREQLD